MYKNTPAHVIFFGLVALMNSSPILNNLFVAFLLCKMDELIKDARSSFLGVFDKVKGSGIF